MMRKLVHIIRRHWLLIATIAVLASAVTTVALAPDTATALNVTETVAGFASVLALLWLVAGYRLQGSELALQREELKLQRLALEQQAIELSNSAKLSSLGQIKDLLEKGEAIVANCSLSITEPHEILGQIYRGMESWKGMLESNDPHVVQKSYNEWLSVEVVARRYIGYVVAAMKLYITYHTSQTVDREKDEETFAYVYQSWVDKAPFLSSHAGVAGVVGQHLFMLSPGMAAGRLAFMVAGSRLIGRNLFKDNALEEMRDKILAEGRSLPAICEPWPNFDKAPPRQMPIPPGR